MAKDDRKDDEFEYEEEPDDPRAPIVLGSTDTSDTSDEWLPPLRAYVVRYDNGSGECVTKRILGRTFLAEGATFLVYDFLPLAGQTARQVFTGGVRNWIDVDVQDVVTAPPSAGVN